MRRSVKSDRRKEVCGRLEAQRREKIIKYGIAFCEKECLVVMA